MLDVCSAFSLILEKGAIGEIYNIGSDDSSEVSVMYVAETISNEKLKNLVWKIEADFINGLKNPFNDKSISLNVPNIRR